MKASYLSLNNNTAKERSRKFHIIKYKILIDRLLRIDKSNFFENSSQNYLEFLNKIKSVDLIENGTDFFWSLIHRLNAALDKNIKEDIEKTYIYFLLNAFDSFYLLLPVDSKIQFKGVGSKDIILPKLQLSLSCYPGNCVTLLKVSNTALNYRLNEFDDIKDSNYAITLTEIPLWFRLKKEMICDRIAIMYQKNENIFEEHYCRNCCENIFLGHLFKNKIKKSFELIKATDSVLYDRLTSAIDYIVPLEKDYPNFAIATLKKTIFLSVGLLDEPEVQVADHIIHEQAHCELHCVQDTVLLTNIENNILENYSPWRTDPRPLLGLIHAIYVSHELMCFYISYLLINQNNQEKEMLAIKKIEIIIHQVLIGIKQIKKHQLTNFTLELIDGIQKECDEIMKGIFERSPISISTPPKEITEHMTLWKLNNPNLIIVE